jgi:uncharacterized protein YggE
MHTKTLAAALLVAAVALVGCTTTKVVTAGPTADTIAVNGVGTALSKPDRASVEFGVSATDSDPRKAMAGVSTASAKLTAGLKAAGIAEKDLQTGGVQLQPQYNYRATPAKLTGYQASVNVVAKTENVDKVGDVIVAGTEAGATTVGGVSFDLSEDNPARYSASANAVADARKRAEAMAKAAGRSLGEVVSMGQPQQVQSPVAYRAIGAAYSADAARLEVQPGQLTAGETVNVTFALK